MVITAMCPPCLMAWGMPNVKGGDSAASSVEELIGRLDSQSPYSASVTYAVSLPMTEDDVVYNVQLASRISEADTLSVVDYLIRWSLPRPEGESTGFQAYFDGHLYRFRDTRLQEYHFQWDSIPFLAGGGVQRSGQFVDLLPQSVASELQKMLSSDEYEVSFSASEKLQGKDVSVVSATQTVNGYVGRNFRVAVERGTGLPLRIDNEFNPGQISEQTVTVSYAYPADGNGDMVASTEGELMELYPEVFEKYRESNYRIENMRGLAMPTFSLPSLTGERYSHHKGEPFKAPTLIAIIDPQVGSAKATVEALREVQNSMPRQVDLVLAFMGSNTDQVEEIVGQPEIGETDLISAKSLARDCGTGVYPTILVVDTKGIVANVLLGFNNSLVQDVIQSLALVK